jgi:lactate dehydrogenase-like 2-hydroxyacid dehydrogenase
MDVCMFSTRSYDRASFDDAFATSEHHIQFIEARLTTETAALAKGCQAVCAFVNDDLGDTVLRQLANLGVRYVALRSAGFNHVDLPAADELGLIVVRVPAYSPDAVAEHTVDLGIEYTPLDELWPRCDIISLNAPLIEETHHLVNASTIARCKRGVMLVNTGRGPLIDTVAVVEALKSGQIGSLALDVYEEERALFFEDRSGDILDDDVFARLLTFPNVLITAHQAFLTTEALAAIAEVTGANLDDLAAGRPCPNQVSVP